MSTAIANCASRVLALALVASATGPAHAFEKASLPDARESICVASSVAVGRFLARTGELHIKDSHELPDGRFEVYTRRVEVFSFQVDEVMEGEPLADEIVVHSVEHIPDKDGDLPALDSTIEGVRHAMPALGARVVVALNFNKVFNAHVVTNRKHFEAQADTQVAKWRAFARAERAWVGRRRAAEMADMHAIAAAPPIEGANVLGNVADVPPGVEPPAPYVPSPGWTPEPRNAIAPDELSPEHLAERAAVRDRHSSTARLGSRAPTHEVLAGAEPSRKAPEASSGHASLMAVWSAVLVAAAWTVVRWRKRSAV